MRPSLLYLTLLSVLFTVVAALPVLEPRAPLKGHMATPRAAPGKAGGKVAAPKAPVNACSMRTPTKHKRGLEFEYLGRRDLQNHELTYEISGKIDGGSFGDVHTVIGHPELLAKSANSKAGMKQVSVEEFKEEAERVRKVGQLIDWGFKTDAACNKVYYIIMKKVSGTPFPKTAAYLATSHDKAARKALVDEVAGKVADKMMGYAKHTTILHMDPNGSNVLCIEDANHHIVSVDLVDWGLAGEVDVKHKHMTHALALGIANEALQKLY